MRHITKNLRGSHRSCAIKKTVLKLFVNFVGKYLRRSLIFWKSCKIEVCNIIKKETPIQAFSCEFCDFFENNIFCRARPGYCFCYLLKITINSNKLSFKLHSELFQTSHLQYLPTATVFILFLPLTIDTWSCTTVSLTNIFCSL